MDPTTEKLPRGMRSLFDRLKAGAILCKQAAAAESDAAASKGGFVWFLYPENRRVRSDHAEGFARLKLIDAAGDGLFDGDSQTYRLAGRPAYRNG